MSRTPRARLSRYLLGLLPLFGWVPSVGAKIPAPEHDAPAIAELDVIRAELLRQLHRSATSPHARDQLGSQLAQCWGCWVNWPNWNNWNTWVNWPNWGNFWRNF
jgi:hypothetical protein